MHHPQIGTEPSDNQYLVVDIGLGAVPIMMIGNCGPHPVLVKQKPSRNLLSFIPLFSIITFLLWQTLTYVFVWFYVQAQDWFEPYVFVADLWPPNPRYTPHISLEQNLTIRSHDGGKEGHFCNCGDTSILLPLTRGTQLPGNYPLNKFTP